MSLLKHQYASTICASLLVSISISSSLDAAGLGEPTRLFPPGLTTNQWQQFPAVGYDQPVSGSIYHAEPRLWCGMPLGGLATGCLDIENDGTLGYSTIFSHVWGHDAGSDGSVRWRDIVWAQKNGQLEDRFIDDPSRGKMNAPFLGLSVEGQSSVLSTSAVGDVKKASKLEYWGHYPILDIEYEQDLPVQAGLRCFSPFLPGEANVSNIPGAVFEVRLRNTQDRPVSGRLAFSFPGPRPREANGRPFTRQLVGKNGSAYQGAYVATSERIGYVLAALGGEKVTCGKGLGTNAADWMNLGHVLPAFEAASDSPDGSASVGVDFSLPALGTKTVRFVLAWYAPQWSTDFPYDGVVDRWFTKMYATRFRDAPAVADYLAKNHESLLRRIIAWQSVIYGEKSLPPWLRDGLVNTLHLFPECGFWAAAEPPLGHDFAPMGLYSLVESTVADGQQSCIPCDWYGNLPLVYFYPDLARTTLRAYAKFMREDGAVPFTLGRGLDLLAETQPDRQRTLNGCCYVDLVDRLWQSTGDKSDLKEFYPSAKRSVEYMMSLVPGPAGVISTAGDQWYESMAWPGMSSHVGGVRLATLRLAERMAKQQGDTAFAAKCVDWHAQGSRMMEEFLWAGSHYLIYNDEKNSNAAFRHQTEQKGAGFIADVNQGSGEKSDLVLSYQLDGEWMARFHGLPGVFPKERVKQTLTTIERLNAPLTTAGLLVLVGADGKPTSFGGRMGSLSSMPASAFITAMSYIYEGERETGLRIAHDALNEMVNVQGMTWDMPNIMVGTKEKKQRVYGTDYYQCLSLWGLPAALAGEDIATTSRQGGLVDRVLKAAKSE